MSMPRTALSSNILPPVKGEEKLAVILFSEDAEDLPVLMERSDFTDLGSTESWKLPQTDFEGSLWPAAEARGLLLKRYNINREDTELVNVSRVPFRDDLPPTHATRKGFTYTDTYIVVLKLLVPTERIQRPGLTQWVPRSQVLSLCKEGKQDTYMAGLNAIPGQPLLLKPSK
ncbi:MAG: hypothetical protein DI585_01715 [Pseudomonas fluorescens]|nr:MAG: hypothetical protein DI585_01715 [Pseudomonas fluorescens]